MQNGLPESHTNLTQWSTALPVEDCRGKVQRSPFRINHSLASLKLFEVDQLIDIAKHAKNVYFDAGKVAIDDRWGSIPVPQMPVEEVMSRVQNNGAWIILKEVQNISPGYGAVMEEFTAFVRDIAGESHELDLSKPEMLVIISSPGRLTPFHFDAEANFLVQVRGEKHVWVCDPNDRTVVTDEDIEKYYNQQIFGTYRKGVEERATKFLLKPGEAVHIPTHAAHWVQNGDDVSVSLSLNFEQPRSAYHDALRFNWFMRKLGLHPSAAGKDTGRDRIKAAMLKTAQVTANPILRLAGKQL